MVFPSASRHDDDGGGIDMPWDESRLVPKEILRKSRQESLREKNKRLKKVLKRKKHLSKEEEEEEELRKIESQAVSEKDFGRVWPKRVLKSSSLNKKKKDKNSEADYDRPSVDGGRLRKVRKIVKKLKGDDEVDEADHQDKTMSKDPWTLVSSSVEVVVRPLEGGEEMDAWESEKETSTKKKKKLLGSSLSTKSLLGGRKVLNRKQLFDATAAGRAENSFLRQKVADNAHRFRVSCV